MKTGIFIESTGVYHLTLFHFLKDTFEVCILNPLITNCNKNDAIRKVKNDKKDALTIANIDKFQNIKYSSNFDIEIYTLNFFVEITINLLISNLPLKRNFLLI